MVAFIHFQQPDLHQAFLENATALFRTSLYWHLLEAIVTCWDPTLRCVTIGDPKGDDGSGLQVWVRNRRKTRPWTPNDL